MEYYFYDYDEEGAAAGAYEEDYDNKVLFKINEESFDETFKNCVQPSISQIVGYVGTLIGWNLLCRLAWISSKCLRMGQWIDHIIAFACGCGVLYHTVGPDFVIFILVGITSYLILSLLEYLKYQEMGYIMAGVTIGGSLIYELIWDYPNVWHEIRGVQMVATMKIISLAFDLDAKKRNLYLQHTETKRSSISSIPALFPFLGYLFCPANCVLGPWIPYKAYLQSLMSAKTDFKWILWTVANAVVAIAFLCLSNCFVAMLCMDYSWKWFVAYRDALSIRCSHYFISFLSQASMAAAGVGFGSEIQSHSDVSPLFGNLVTKPWAIEFPRSLTTIVRNWNIPMHYWLKTYVFRAIKLRGRSLFHAIVGTYLASSLLHGLHFQIYAVLLSLGLFTYAEYKLRNKIATIFKACIHANPCKIATEHSLCQQHEHRWNTIFVCLINCVFGLLTVIHLAYLGIMLDGTTSSSQHQNRFSIETGLSKWMQLDFLSHWVFALTYLFYIII